MDNKVAFNQLPRPTFRWLKVNHTDGLAFDTTGQAGTISIEAREGIITDLTDTSLLNATYEGAQKEALQEVATDFTHGYAVTVPEGANESITLVIDADASAINERTRLRLQVAEKAAVEMLIVLKGQATVGTVQLFIEADVATGAKATIKKAQLLGEKVQQIEHRYTTIASEGKVEYINLEVGGQDNLLNYQEDLVGDKSEVIHDLAYMGDKEQRFDISMLMSHQGKKTMSDIHTLGALSGTAKKSFRGTLDFLRGSQASEGAEEDTCLLLNPNVKSISLPLLLCKEDDVSGNHAASAGQIDQNKLFYLMSRGFSEVEAKHMIVESMLRPVIDRIGHEEIEELTLTAVRNKI